MKISWKFAWKTFVRNEIVVVKCEKNENKNEQKSKFVINRERILYRDFSFSWVGSNKNLKYN